LRKGAVEVGEDVVVRQHADGLAGIATAEAAGVAAYPAETGETLQPMRIGSLSSLAMPANLERSEPDLSARHEFPPVLIRPWTLRVDTVTVCCPVNASLETFAWRRRPFS
jgi:hypothetical protein